VFEALIALGIRSGAVYRVNIADGSLTTIHSDGRGPSPDGVVVRDGVVYWTTMGVPTRDPALKGEASLDYSVRNGGLHAVRLDGTDARDVVPVGSLTTGKQLTLDAAGTLYWGDREGCRVSCVRTDGTGLTDLVVNTRDDSWLAECVGVAVTSDHLYWTQKGPAKGGKGRILRAGLAIPAGQTAADRTDIEVLWDHLPEPIDLEVCGGWLYWTDRGDPPAGNTLNRAPLPGPGTTGAEPQILADGFTEAIGLAIDKDTAYVSDLGGHIRAVPLPGRPGESRLVADMGEPISGIAGI
jgi:sugar lactone lactonase YvrE